MNSYLRWMFLVFLVFLAFISYQTYDSHSCAVYRSMKFGRLLSTRPNSTKTATLEFFHKEKEEKHSHIIETVFGPKSYKEIESLIFRPLGYKIRESTVIPALGFIERPYCPKVFSDWLKQSEGHNESATPPRDIPFDLLDDYTFNGQVHLIKGYKDDRSGTQKAVWTREVIEKAIAKEPNQVTRPYAGDAAAVYHAMKTYNVSGKRGAVVGSLTPYVEAFALKLGAEHLTTMEYRHIEIPDDDRIEYKHPVDVAKEASKYFGKYDFIASFSSIEHSGLGRYGDALDPIGDLREAMKIHCMLKDNGLFFIGLPLGWDTLHWNLHRIYGRIRFALFASGFEILEIFNRDGKQEIAEDLFPKPYNMGSMFQWVIVLRKR